MTLPFSAPPIDDPAHPWYRVATHSRPMDQAKATPEDRKAALMAHEADRSPKAYVDDGVRLVSDKDAPDVEQPGIEVHKIKGRSKFSAAHHR